MTSPIPLTTGKAANAMTDVWCFTCSHELKQTFGESFLHLDPDDEPGCPCIADEEECGP